MKSVFHNISYRTKLRTICYGLMILWWSCTGACLRAFHSFKFFLVVFRKSLVKFETAEISCPLIWFTIFSKF